MRCIYCGKTDKEVSFNRREHVVPKLMGGFNNNTLLHKLVCDTCNSKVFSPLESEFKEDTVEGLRFQMVNFNNDSQIRVRAEKVIRTIKAGFKEKMFDDMFPFLKIQADGTFKVASVPQIVIKNNNGKGFTVLIADKLKNINKQSSRFRDLKYWFRNTDQKNVSIFVGSNEANDQKEMEEAIQLVRDLGIDYKEGKRIFVESKDIEGTKLETELKATVNNSVGRIIAKIAFNYFAYCAEKEGRADILFSPSFNKIKKYILGELDVPIKEIIPLMQTEPIIQDEKVENSRLLGHMVSFRQHGDYIIAELSFLGGNIYTVVLGEIPDEFKRKDFGCGHIFDPISRNIHQLTKNESKWGSGQEAGWGLFKID